MASLFSDFLGALGVRHTEGYSDRRFEQMPFQSMFGIAELLKEYGVGATGVMVDEAARKDALLHLPLPFLADTPDGFIIILSVCNGNVTYMSQHRTFTTSITEIIDGWNGIALLATAASSAAEPGYSRHHIAVISTGIKKWLLIALAAIMALVGMWTSGLYSHASAWFIALLDCAGILLSWMLVQKSLGIRSEAADKVCSALEEGGCDEIASSEAASFMGIFKWSEVGLSYFSVSLLSMLIFPETMTALAAINILCLPYTVWSISYQKFKAKVWCTLCVGVQLTLWLLAGCYLAGGWTAEINPTASGLYTDILMLGACYVGVLLGLNTLDNALSKLIKQ